MTTPMNRRTMLRQGGAVLGNLVACCDLPGQPMPFPLVQNAVVIPWLDQPEPNPVP